MKVCYITLLLILISQTAMAAPDNPCTEDPNFKAFDFWLGEWEVHDKAGKFQGRNIIEKTEGDCLIKESWTSAGNTTGFSMNYYNPITGLWTQIWVSQGAIIEYNGKPEKPGELTLEGTIYYHGNNTKAPFRGTWTLLDDGRVRQYFEQYHADKQAWQVWFDGYYSKVSKQQ